MENHYSINKMDTAEVIQVIKTTIKRRGAGKDESDPVRIITQFWSLDGKLLAEVDPFKEQVCSDDRVFTKLLIPKKQKQ